MAWYFFDASALVRRYRRDEPGGAIVDALCRPSAGQVAAIARIASVEIAAAFSRWQRSGALDDDAAQRHWRAYQRHLSGQYRVVEVDAAVLDRAVDLVLRHQLAAARAIQLATALQLRAVAGLMTELYFCTADRAQAEAAEREGLVVELIV